MAKVRVLLILAAAAFLLLPGIASADDEPYCAFAGTVKLDDADVADYTTITATVAGQEYTTTTPTGYGASTYAITIRPPEGAYYADGTEVAFKINGYAAHQTGIFQAGKNVRLDLTASTSAGTLIPTPPPSPESPANVWLIVGLVIAGIIGASLVGGVAYIVFTNWNR